jgi:oligoendopeptidase F
MKARTPLDPVGDRFDAMPATIDQECMIKSGIHFYNYPYTMGLLFGLGLYQNYRSDPERFRVGYDNLLSRCGMDSFETLGSSFGLDVSDESFWNASLDVLRRRMDEYAKLAQPHLK